MGLEAKEKQRNAYLLRTYGITTDQYNEILHKQGSACAICERPYWEFKTRLAVDHDHISGQVRGLVCNYCNRRLIGRHRDPELLRRLADYVSQGTGFYVPKKRATKKRRPKRV